VEKDLKQAGAKTLMLSLDGALRYLPYAALHDGKEYLMQSYRTVLYAEVASAKVALPAKASWQVAALGVSKKHGDFAPLGKVPYELACIVKQKGSGVIPGEIHLDEEFTQASLQDASTRYPVLHIASHFRFIPGTEHDSFLLLGDGSHLTLDQVRGSSYFEDSELLTLSACETAMGSSGKGSEIEGFGALAMNQGAKAVIATLWPVADESTALLMANFYKLREEKKIPKVEALRQAQLALLTGEIKPGTASDTDRGMPVYTKTADKDENAILPRFKTDPKAPYAHPYFWAPFIMMGNWK
jgi:CHAT domain-containing protein